MRIFTSIFILIFLFACGQASKQSDASIVIAEAGFTDSEGAISDSTYADSDGSEGKEAGDWFNPINAVGIGLVNIQTTYIKEDDRVEYFRNLSLYNDEKCTDLFVSYDFTKGLVPSNKNILPIYNNVEYSYYCFIVLSEQEDSYKVAINDTETKYIKKQHNRIFYTWTDFYETVFYIEQSEENPFRTEPSDDAEIITIEMYDEEADFIYSEREVTIDGEWMYVTFPNLANTKGFWVRWRNEDKIVLGVYLSI